MKPPLKVRLIVGITVALFALGLSSESPGFLEKKTVDQQRAEIRKMSRNTLAKLYKLKPSAKAAIKSAAGYAVFSNFGTKILVAGGGSGKGVAVNNATGKETFMKMIEVQAGLGLGVKKFQVVFIFENENALNSFISSGWEFGGQTTAAAKVQKEGAAAAGAASVSPGVWMYQMTETGLAAELTVKGTKYLKDSDLSP